MFDSSYEYSPSRRHKARQPSQLRRGRTLRQAAAIKVGASFTSLVVVVSKKKTRIPPSHRAKYENQSSSPKRSVSRGSVYTVSSRITPSHLALYESNHSTSPQTSCRHRNRTYEVSSYLDLKPHTYILKARLFLRE
ncbi:hypothetical protein BJ508DRAFT_180058 [Ascobolus immersus RN42]|uniref:Uncharacterized protein n=1 Tax=Ascobolus immersus RN42 TaxID=1160509 RepID=A0A3N4HV18_ASCIM|nr:hypothetical protein BJ508DRAFT_180058 [Ascobolus immersus RN42]